ncbi:MAG: hypothetical protein AAGA23_20720, partial [Pseudomonadota bacterium]
MTDSLMLNLMLGHLALGAALVLGLLLLRRFFSKASAAHWHSAWAVALLVLLALPLLALVPRAEPEAALPPPAAMEIDERPAAPANPPLGRNTALSPAPINSPAAVPKVGLTVVLLWFLLAVYQLFLLLRALRYVGRMRRSGWYVEVEISQQADALARTAGRRRPGPVRWGDAAGGPPNGGSRKPRVRLPGRGEG